MMIAQAMPQPSHTNHIYSMEGVETLRFNSWWFEGKTKKYVTLSYALREDRLIAEIQDLPGEHEIVNAKTKAGTDLECWDLFVGAEIRVFGKSVVLKQCDLATSQWIAYYSQSLRGPKDRLVLELRKYEVKLLPAWLLQSADSELHGGTNLRLLQKQCKELKARLERFRPKLAQAIVTAGLTLRLDEVLE